MPNHIKNRIEIKASKEQLKEVFDRFNTHVPAKLKRSYDEKIICIKGDESGDWSVGWFDEKTGLFSQRNQADVIGLPDGFNFEINEAFDVFPDFEKVIPPPDCDEYKDLPSQEVARKSPNWWYTWNIENWGTKWSGYSFEKISDNVFTFNTAWNSCPLIIEKISKEFPEIEIIYEYSDEDFGYNVGEMLFKNGCVYENIPEVGSLEAYEIGFKVRPDYKKYYKLVGESYEYVESED